MQSPFATHSGRRQRNHPILYPTAPAPQERAGASSTLNLDLLEPDYSYPRRETVFKRF
jgi:hypothetical protein